MDSFDKIKQEFEKNLKIKIKTIINYDENYIILVLAGDTIPGEMYKIHKETGKTEAYFPAADMEKWLSIKEDQYKTYE